MKTASKLTQRQRAEILAMVSSGQKSESEAARLFGVHPSTVSRLLAQERHAS